jgi:hypothetical protein
MALSLEASEFVGSFLNSRERRTSLIAQALDSSAAVVWTTDLEGTVTMCEGGGLLSVGGTPGHCVGVNLRSVPSHIPFEDALIRLKKGEPAIKYVINGLLDRPASSDQPTIDGPWLLSISYLRSASGRPVGVACVTIPLHGATPLAVFSACPLGSCMLEERGHE